MEKIHLKTRSRKSIVESTRKLKILKSPTQRKDFSLRFNITKPKIIKPLSPKSSSTSFLSTSQTPSSNFLTFSTLTRFNNTIFDKFKGNKKTVRPFQLKKLSPTEKSSQTLRILKNKDMSPHHPSEKKLKIDLNHQKLITSQTLAGLAKKEIDSDRYSNFKELLDKKFRRFEINQHKIVFFIQENFKAKTSWAVLLIVSCVSFRLARKTCLLKLLKSKNFNKWRTLRRFFATFVKFVKLLQNVREKFALIVIRRTFPAFVRDWVKVIKGIKKKALCSCVERFMKGRFFARFFKKIEKKVKNF
jgi:hypothetical protein